MVGDVRSRKVGEPDDVELYRPWAQENFPFLCIYVRSNLPVDAVTKRDDLSWVVGDATRGLISEKGIYLSPESGWYPRTLKGGLARFDVTSYVPEPSP